MIILIFGAFDNQFFFFFFWLIVLYVFYTSHLQSFARLGHAVIEIYKNGLEK